MRRFELAFLQEWLIVFDNRRREMSYIDVADGSCFHRRKVEIGGVIGVFAMGGTPVGGVFLLTGRGELYDYNMRSGVVN